jgi:hypothetical protein
MQLLLSLLRLCIADLPCCLHVLAGVHEAAASASAVCLGQHSPACKPSGAAAAVVMQHHLLLLALLLLLLPAVLKRAVLLGLVQLHVLQATAGGDVWAAGVPVHLGGHDQPALLDVLSLLLSQQQQQQQQ